MDRNNHVEELRNNREARAVRNMQSKCDVGAGKFIQRWGHTVQRYLVGIERDPGRQRGTVCLQNGIVIVIHTRERVAVEADTKRPAGRDAERRILRYVECRDNISLAVGQDKDGTE